ncbi:MAG: hypothetical protein RI562_11275 [Salibacter sp.]|uniref:hypothetical protein n=1 Tax=Salibacter sp. TaxID=2010995 RepID=UPI0028704D95|nr:hypothetical protein [Salibacter sp.]MDR9399632.1 hypothetical protein [Salibacter sp.]
MKKLYFVIALACLSLFSCKKDEDDQPAPAQSPPKAEVADTVKAVDDYYMGIRTQTNFADAHFQAARQTEDNGSESYFVNGRFLNGPGENEYRLYIGEDLTVNDQSLNSDDGYYIFDTPNGLESPSNVDFSQVKWEFSNNTDGFSPFVHTSVPPVYPSASTDTALFLSQDFELALDNRPPEVNYITIIFDGGPYYEFFSYYEDEIKETIVFTPEELEELKKSILMKTVKITIRYSKTEEKKVNGKRLFFETTSADFVKLPVYD